ncbi:hypothetical protein GC163_23635 [bacterium]|nr:hypothetical protein [bacterium]
MTTSSNHQPVSTWDGFKQLMHQARSESAPLVDVTAPVLARISQTPQVSWQPVERVILASAGVSAVLAASLLFVVWTTSQNLVDPASGWFQPFEVTLLERP